MAATAVTLCMSFRPARPTFAAPSSAALGRFVRIAQTMSDDEAAAATAKMEELAVANEDDELSLGLGKKKKKKAKKVELVLDEELQEENDGGAEADAEAAAGAEPSSMVFGEDGDDLGLDLKKTKKKKKKSRKEELDLDEDGDELGGIGTTQDGDLIDDTGKGSYPWSGQDRDYTHEELLERVFGILRERNPELTGERRRTVLKPPQVAREGTKKTVFTNFMDLCKAMNRQNEHVSAYLLAELGTSGSLDGQQRLIVKGRFLPKSFETVLRRYVSEYVLCPSCKSVDTLLDRDSATRLMHLRCQQCGASRTVQAIKSGFVARVTRRVQAAG